MFNHNAVWQLFFDTLAVILRKTSEIVEKFLSPALEIQFVDFIKISGNRCTNTNLH